MNISLYKFYPEILILREHFLFVNIQRRCFHVCFKRTRLKVFDLVYEETDNQSHFIIYSSIKKINQVNNETALVNNVA